MLWGCCNQFLQTGGSGQRKYILLQFWEPRSEIQASREDPSSPPPAAGGLQLLGFLGL